VEAIAWGRDGTLWVGTPNGLNAFDPRRGVAVRIPFQPGRRDGLPANWVPDLMVARDGRLWVATSGGACLLKSWDGRTARFESVNERLGRRPEPVDSLIEDAEGKVWFGPRLRIDWKAGRYQELGPADGLDLHDFFIASRARTADGMLLFGSPGGLLTVRPERLAPWTYAPPVVATALRVDGVERPGAARLKRLELGPRERSFRLDFAALDFSAPARNAYRYRLEGYDDRWTRTDAALRTLAFNALPPGSYRLRIQGTNRAGLWSPHEIRLPIHILPAFYQTFWFKALAAVVALTLVYSGIRLRVARLEARGRALEEQVRERTLSLEEKNRELALAYERIEEASLTDPLTQARNRRFLEATLEGDLEICARRHEAGATGEAGEADLLFLLLDLDHFKSVNDTHGHAAGDAVLSQTAELLRQVLRTSDHLVRWGGEEFLVVARFVDRRRGSALAEKIRAAIEERGFPIQDGTVLRRTASIGFAAYPFSPDSPRALGWQEIVSIADAGLYIAKRGGRNASVGIEHAAGDPSEVLRHLSDDPAKALAAGEIRLVAPHAPCTKGT
jgi:diguanylate cyclase (GGDEF)-like protein